MRLRTLVLPLLALLAASCAAPPRRAPATGGPAVELKVRGMDGKELDFASLRGKVVVVDAWATWCGPCIQALPGLEKLSRHRPEDIVVVGLSVDQSRQDLVDFLERKPLPYFVAHADRDAQRIFRTHALPTVFVLDREGVIRETLVGMHPDSYLFETAERYL